MIVATVRWPGFTFKAEVRSLVDGKKEYIALEHTKRFTIGTAVIVTDDQIQLLVDTAVPPLPNNPGTFIA